MCFECEEIDKSKRNFLKGATTAMVGAALNSQAFGQQTSSPKALDNPKVIHQAVTFKNGARTYLTLP